MRIKFYAWKMTATIDGRSLKLTPIGFEILMSLWMARGRCVTIQRLLIDVWGYTEQGAVALTESTNTVRQNISIVRKAMGRDGKRIVAVRGRGYKLTR